MDDDPVLWRSNNTSRSSRHIRFLFPSLVISLLPYSRVETVIVVETTHFSILARSFLPQKNISTCTFQVHSFTTINNVRLGHSKRMSFGRPTSGTRGGQSGCRVAGAAQYRPRPPSRPESHGSASGDTKWEVWSVSFLS